MITREPLLNVGILEGVPELHGELHGDATCGDLRLSPGQFTVRSSGSRVVLRDSSGREFSEEYGVSLVPAASGTFLLHDVIIGLRFHWERKEDQRFEGWLRIVARKDGTLTAINEVPLEAYLKSVISSEMSATAPEALLEAHAITSRSWLVAMLERARTTGTPAPATGVIGRDTTEIVRWYTREDHDLFDVCADDHCQRYQGITKIISPTVSDAVEKTRGLFLVSEDAVCDARFYKSCGGITDEFQNTWEPIRVPYLRSLTDSTHAAPPILTETGARAWISAEPEAFCNTKDRRILRQVLPSFDQETLDFFRWTVRYTRQEVESLIQTKGGVDLGTLTDILPEVRGPSGRISKLRLVGTGRTLTIGKELEIRRWLSPSHLYSSAFVVDAERGPDGVPLSFTLRGAGWGHGVGLCQLGAAVMAMKGYTPDQIVLHYFPGAELRRLY